MKQSLRMNLQKCLSLKEIIQSLNSAINHTDHDTQTHFRIWNDFRIIFIFFLYRGRTPAFIFDTEKRTQVRVSQWEGHRSVKWRHTTHRRQTSVINQFKLITVLLKIKGTTLYLSVPIFKRERIKIQLSEFNFYSVNSKNILSISSYLYCWTTYIVNTYSLFIATYLLSRSTI